MNSKLKFITAPAGIEPATSWLTVNYSTAELRGNELPWHYLYHKMMVVVKTKVEYSIIQYDSL